MSKLEVATWCLFGICFLAFIVWAAAGMVQW